MEDYKMDGPKASKMLVKLFPTKIHLQQPQVSIKSATHAILGSVMIIQTGSWIDKAGFQVG